MPWKTPSFTSSLTKVAVKAVLRKPCICSTMTASQQTLPGGRPGLIVSLNYRCSAVTSVNSLTSVPSNYPSLPIVSAMPTLTPVFFPTSPLLAFLRSHGHRLLNIYSRFVVAQVLLTQYRQANALASSASSKVPVSIVANGDTVKFTALAMFPLVLANPQNAP